MATITNGIELINAMREVASSDYQERIPVATKDNLALIGEMLDSLDYKPLRNEFTGLIEKIALTIFNERAYSNHYKLANRGRLPEGSTIEEIATEMAKSSDFDPSGEGTLARKVPVSFNFYHTHMSERTYSVSISRYQMRTGFSSEGNLNRFLTNIINTLYNGYEYDEELIFKQTLGEIYPDCYQIVAPRPTDAESSRNFLALLREYTLNLNFYSTEYNPVGHKTFCPTERLVLIVDSKTISKVSVEALASAFNKSDLDYTTRILPVDNFGDWTKVYDNGNISNIGSAATAPYAFLLDEEVFQFYEQAVFMDTQHNAKGAFDTMYLHCRKNYAWSKARTMIAFTEVPLIAVRVADDVKTSTGAFALTSVWDVFDNEVYAEVVNGHPQTDMNFPLTIYTDGKLTTYTKMDYTIVYTTGATINSSATIGSGITSIDLSSDDKNISEILITSLS